MSREEGDVVWVDLYGGSSHLALIERVTGDRALFAPVCGRKPAVGPLNLAASDRRCAVCLGGAWRHGPADG